MSEPKIARPPQVTMAGWLVVVGSVVVVVLAFVQVAGLRSLETREAVEESLSRWPGDALGLDVQDTLSLMRIACMVAAATAAAAAILGWQALQRSKGARVALSLLALPLFVAGLVIGGYASPLVSAAIVTLWFQPARDWFNGVTPAPVPEPLPPVPHQPVGRDPLLDLPPPTQPPIYPTAYAAGNDRAEADSRARPAAVTWACVLTWLFCAGAFVLFTAAVALMIAAPGNTLDDIYRQNPDLADESLTDAELRRTFYFASGVIMAWSAAAAGLAVLVWRRGVRAREALMVTTGLAGGLCLLGVVVSPVLLVPLAACAATVALLLRPESRTWFRRRSPSA